MPVQVTGLRRVSAGATLQTWAFDAVRGAQVQPLILRRAPGEHRAGPVISLPAEAALIEAVRAQGVPVAQVVQVLQPAHGLGEGFVMTRISGETLARKLQRDDTFAAVRPRLAAQLGAALGHIHRVPLAALPPLPVASTAATLALLQAQQDALARPSAVFAWALRWLHAQRPPDPAPALVHGDFRVGNVIVDPVQGLAGVLDWELAHVGDPYQDLAWPLVPAWRFGQIDRPLGGLSDLPPYLAAWCAASGLAFDPARLRWWRVAGSLRWGLMCAGMRAWFASGRDTGVERAMIARRSSESELDLLRLLDTEDPHA